MHDDEISISIYRTRIVELFNNTLLIGRSLSCTRFNRPPVVSPSLSLDFARVFYDTARFLTRARAQEGSGGAQGGEKSAARAIRSVTFRLGRVKLTTLL